MATASDAVGVTLPVVSSPKLLQGVRFAFLRRRAMRRWIGRYGRTFEINVPVFGRAVVTSDPAAVRAVCTSNAGSLVNVQPNLGNWFGPGSVFALDDDAHRRRRRTLSPAFHGHGLKWLEELVLDETLRECSTWVDGKEFRTLEPMTRITLNVILRTLFDVPGGRLDELRELILPYMTIGQVLAFLPAPPPWVRRFGPWRALDECRSAFDAVVDTMIDAAAGDPGLAERTDVLARLVRAGVSRRDVADELLTLIGAGHETTAAALCWTFERVRRHPDVLAALVTEVDEGGSDQRRAAITEVLRVRTVIDVCGRRVVGADVDIGGVRIPRSRNVLVRIADLHENPEVFADPGRFDPSRFRGATTATAGWLAFGGGARRCLGAEYALLEMDVVLRTVLRHFWIRTDSEPGERAYFRGIANVPKRGGRMTVYRRT